MEYFYIVNKDDDYFGYTENYRITIIIMSPRSQQTS